MRKLTFLFNLLTLNHRKLSFKIRLQQNILFFYILSYISMSCSIRRGSFKHDKPTEPCVACSCHIDTFHLALDALIS